MIENIETAPVHGVTICGSWFPELRVARHRVFETSFLILHAGRECRHTGREIGVYGKFDGRRLFTRRNGSELRAPRSLEEARVAMGIDWMDEDELKEAIPPAYTEFIGTRLLERMGVRT